MNNLKLVFVLAFALFLKEGVSQNLIDPSTWVVGTGNVPGFYINGTNEENVREIDINPHGESAVIWKAYPDNSSNADGGMYTDQIPINPSSTYRLSIWIKKLNSNDGSTYFGFRDASRQTILRLNGTHESDPYFFGSDLPQLNQWYLLVAYVHDKDYSSTVSQGGIYDLNGTKLQSFTDFKFSISTASIMFRSYLFFDTNTNDSQYFYGPAMFELNGLEPTIQELIDGPNGNTSDTQPPTPPVLASVVHNGNTVNLSWSGATDNTGVTGYKIFKDGALEATLGNVGTYQVTGLIAGTSYSFTATALDAAGNESAASNVVTVTTSTSGTGGSDNTVWSETGSVASYTGDVAVGTASVPTGYKMAVDGKLITEEVKVQLSGNWPDYVFTKDYELPSLEAVQRHINEKGHLPNVPLAKEVEANGIQLGEMNRLLLEKIEELMLYTLKQNEALKNQHKINQHLWQRLKKIEKRFNISNDRNQEVHN